MQKLEVSNFADLQAELNKQTARAPEGRFLHRLHCVLLVARGCSCYQVAEWFREHPSTIERWVHHFLQFGAEGLRDEQRTGRPAKLRDDQRKRLQNDVSNEPGAFGYERNIWHGRLLQDHLERHYCIKLSVRQCQRLLKQLRRDPSSEVATALEDTA